MAHEFLKLDNMAPTVGYSHAAKVGNMLFISGQVAQDAQGNVVGKGDVEAQAKQVFENLKKILEQAGGSMQNIFKMTTLLTHPSYLEAFRGARNLHFSEPFPANTLHVVQALAHPDWLIEVEAFAVLD